MNLENTIKDAITEKLNDGTVEKLIAEQLEASIKKELSRLDKKKQADYKGRILLTPDGVKERWEKSKQEGPPPTITSGWAGLSEKTQKDVAILFTDEEPIGEAVPMLKPCPFCGAGARLIVRRDADYHAACMSVYKCGARFEWYDTEQEAIAAWNTRI